MALTWPRPLHLLLVVPLVALLVGVYHLGSHRRDDPAAVLQALRAARGLKLPAAESAGFATRTESTRYDPETLYEFIDGAADSYIANGFTECLAAIYTMSQTAVPVEISAETYRFKNEEGARKQLDFERPAAALPVSGLEAAVSDGAVLLLLEGHDLLKLTVLTPDPAASAALTALASSWRKESARDTQPS